MDEVERYQHLLHAKLLAFKRKVEQAQRIIEETLTTLSHPYASFSGGSDSLVMLDLLFLAGFRGTVRWVDDGWDFPESMTFLKETEARYGFRLQRMRSLHNWREWCQEMGRPDLGADPAAYEAWGNPREWDGGWSSHAEWLQSIAGYDGAFMGLLAAESRSRRLVLHNGTKPLYQVKAEEGMWHCSPLARWTKRDVWGYLISREVPYNPVYDKLAVLGVPVERRRVGPLVCLRVMQYGSHAVLRHWPELYNRLCATFPCVREYS